MSNEIKNEQDPQETTLNVDFSHRLSPLLDAHGVTYLVDTLDQMTARAIAMLFVLEDYTDRSNDMLNPEIIGNFINAIRLEVTDIQQTARAHHAANRGKNETVDTRLFYD